MLVSQHRTPDYVYIDLNGVADLFVDSDGNKLGYMLLIHPWPRLFLSLDQAE